MPERPHPILDRTEAEKLIEQHFSHQAALIEELANYGSNLFIRAFNTGEKGLGDAVVCGVLLKQIVAMLDATAVLFRAGNIYAANLPARAGFEASLYLEWMLAADIEKKARYYYVANLRAERHWASRAVQGTPEHEDFSKSLAQLNVDLNALRPTLQADARSHLGEVNRILGQPEFANIDQEFTKQRGRRKSDPEWYTLLGVKSIRQIAEQLHRLLEYDLFYARGSTITHAGAYKDHLRFSTGQLHFKQIRSLDGIAALLNFIVALAMRSYQWVLTYYRNEELPRFWAQYLNEWREPFVNVKDVNYRY